ncbi:MAG: glycosyltransferase family 39 protein, partial [Actinomycetota bacterium]|nr:glycosyltransferase family 39 protein [Actinomycetota bacterium]
MNVQAERSESMLPAIAWRWVGAAMAVLAVVLTATSNAYGFERDELYFRMLAPRWGYVDQPPFTPLLSRLAASLSSAPWVERVPATICAVLSVLVVALITRELGGRAGAQGLCAWAYSSASIPLVFGHVLLTTTIDLLVWPLSCLFTIRALRRAEPRWWLAAGGVIGLSTYNKLLVILLVVALLAGLLVSGPRRALAERWLWVGALLALLLAVPNLAYQARNHWPQLTMSHALSEHNAGSVRILMWPYLVLLLGPPLVPIWVAGLVALRRRPQWRAVRFLATAFAILLVETFLGGGQLYYPIGLLAVVFAAGCVPAADFLARSMVWRRVAWVAVAVNATVSALIALPLVPASVLADTPIPSINQTVGDQLGWSDYVAQIASVYRSVPASEHPVLIASNYGEAGALTQYGPSLGLPRPYSGQNELYFDARPPEGTSTAVIVGGQLADIHSEFASCMVVTQLHNRVGVDNEEVGEPVAVCHGPKLPWSVL